MTEQAGGEEVPTFELGDRVMILGGQLDQTRGRIYYMDSDLIRILPDGASDRLVELPLEEGDFASQLGIENFYLLSKAAAEAFVAQIDAQVEQIVDTFGENGEPGIQYTIRSINEGADTMVIEDEAGGRKELAFRSEFHRGIELSEPFIVLRPRYRAEEGDNANGNVNTAEATNEDEEILFEDVELPEEDEQFVGLIERPAALRIYPDSVQRNDMFVQLLEMLDTNIQKLPARQRETRQLTEQLLLLRNELVKYSVAGDPVGQYPTSFQTISELIEKADIPLARPVLDAKRSLYVTDTEAINRDAYNVDVYSLNDAVKESTTFLETQLNAAAGGTDTLPNWYVTWDAFFRTYMRSFSSSGSPGDTILFRGDKEFLRAPAPREGDMEVDGVPILGKESGVTVGKLQMSLLKGVGPRMTRVKAKGNARRIESGDEGVVTTQLIFPLSTERDLGSIRSGSLTRDIQNSHITSKSLQTTVKELGGVPDEATAGGILSIGENGNTNGNIGIDDWLKAQPLVIRGLGDALIQMKSLGLTQKELTADQQTILIDKIKAYRASLKHYITEEIESSKAALAALRLENETFLQGEALEELMTVLSTEPLLATRLDEVKKLLPAYKENDIAIVAAVNAQMSELFLTAMSGQPAPLARERNRRVRDQFLEALRNAMTKARNKENAGELPTPNRCPHVNDLAIIRQIVDDSERMAHLSAFVTNYKKGREGNWIMCNNCPQPILCYHEELQIQEFKHPREKDVLHKELLLAFSGGQFHGKYMCKNCGQGISDMDFDRGMEFTENGIPLAGGAGAPLEDAGEATEEALTKLIGAGAAEDGVDSYTTDIQKIIYQAASKLYQAVGVYPGNDVLRGVVQRVEAEILLQPSQDEYARAIKARAAKGIAAAGTITDYDVFINRVIVCAIAAHVIIEIQTHIPDYVPRYRIPGCVAGFTGYPLGREEDKTILNYISCAVAGITDTSRPWGLSVFMLIQNDKKRQEAIAARVETIVKAAMKTAVVQSLITSKKVHYEKIYGSVEGGGSLIESIPPGFRPVPYVIPAEEAAKAVIVPEAAGPQELTRAWIQTGHRIARQNGKYIRGTPYSEASCCYTPLAEPRGFWAEKSGSLPSLPIKQPPVGQHGSQLMFSFKARRQPRLLADPPDDLFYRVFLRVCYDGPRKGLPHEPGYTNRCPHCGFTFPDSPYIESPVPPLSIQKSVGDEMMKEWKAEMDAIITKGKAALESQKVVMTKAAFEELLDTTHMAYRVAVPERIQPVIGMDLLAKFGTIEPEPFDGWRAILMETMTRVAKLSTSADEIEVAEAYGPMSDVYMRSLGDIERRLGAGKRQTLQALLDKSPSQVYESVRTYFLVTFQRLLNGFKPESLKVLKGYKLPTGVADDIHKEMYARLGFLHTIQKTVKGYTRSKLETVVKQLAVVLPLIQNEIRANLIPGGVLGLPYFVGTLISGILAEFINPNVMPTQPIVGAVGTLDATTRVPLNILDTCLIRLETEGLLYTEEQIRERIAKRIEAEKVAVLRRMDNMTPEEKRVTLMNQRLGLKEYAVGGTKAIFLLNEDQYERERIQRGEMGLATEFGATGEMAEAMQQFANEEAYGGGGDGAEGGYDNVQMDADDY